MNREEKNKLLNRMVRDLRGEYSQFEIMTDEEFYNSRYGESRRARGPRNKNVFYFHCLVPGSTLNLVSGYFSNNQIRFPINIEYSKINSIVKVEYKYQKNRYWEAFVIREDAEQLYLDSLQFMRDFLDHVLSLHPEYKKNSLAADWIDNEDTIPLNNDERFIFYKMIDAKKNICLVKTNDDKTYVQKEYDRFGKGIFERLQSLNIKGIPKIIECLEKEGKMYVVEEYIRGNDLSTMVEEHGIFGEDEVLNISLQLCSILKQLHDLTPSLIHRDIKPSNIMLKKNGEVILIDFNATKEFHDGENEDTVWAATKYYAAPEQIGGYAQSDVRTDIYSLGATMNYLLCKMRINQIICPGKLHDIIEKCVEIDPKSRYQYIDELIIDLKNIK